MNGKQDSDEFMQDNSIETTKLQQEALDILIEDCAEVIQAISKFKRFGDDTINSETNVSNKKALTKELADLAAVLRLAEQCNAIVPLGEEVIVRATARKRSYSSL